MYLFIKDNILKIKDIQNNEPYIKISDLQLLKIIETTINIYEDYVEKSNKKNIKQNEIKK